MNQIKPEQANVNFAAVSFAIQYYQYEHPLTQAFGVVKGGDDPGPWQALAKWAAHFAVARNLTGIGAGGDAHRERVYRAFVDIVKNNSTPHGGETRAARALRVESELQSELGISSSLLSATTKFLWLVDRKSIIYDSKLCDAMKATDNSYEAYCGEWERQFTALLPMLEVATEALRKIPHMFPSTWTIDSDSKEDWFIRRTFDTLHWTGSL